MDKNIGRKLDGRYEITELIGMGGISTWEDAVEMMLAGASAIQMGTAIFTDPYAPLKVKEGLAQYMDDNGIKSLSEIVGQVQPW